VLATSRASSRCIASHPLALDAAGLDRRPSSARKKLLAENAASRECAAKIIDSA
jgi:hypothetical protein